MICDVFVRMSLTIAHLRLSCFADLQMTCVKLSFAHSCHSNFICRLKFRLLRFYHSSTAMPAIQFRKYSLHKMKFIIGEEEINEWMNAFKDFRLKMSIYLSWSREHERIVGGVNEISVRQINCYTSCNLILFSVYFEPIELILCLMLCHLRQSEGAFCLEFLEFKMVWFSC